MRNTSSHPGKLKIAAATVGAAALLVAGVGVTAEAASKAKPVLAGANNKAQKTTKLSSKKGPALALKSKKGPALSVNSNALIPNLNADMLDGLDSKTLDPNVTEIQLGPDGVTLPAGTVQTFLQTSLPAGTYEMSFHGIYLSDTQCLALNPAILSTPTPDYNQLWLADIQGTSTSGDSIVQDSNIVTLTATTTVDFGCVYDSANPVIVADSLELHVRKVNTLTAGTGTPTTIVPKAGAKLPGILR